MALLEETIDLSTNLKLSQLKNILNKNYVNTTRYMQPILTLDSDINLSIQSTPYLESKQPKLIGCTPLHLAAMENSFEGVMVLLDNDADLTVKNKEGLTVLHQILEKFHREESKLRLDNHIADLILMNHRKNLINPCTNYGLSHFHAACLTDRSHIVKLFLEHGVSFNHSVAMDSKIFPGYSPLHFAIRSYDFENVQLLINPGANICLRNSEGKTPLHMLIEQKIKILNDDKYNDLVAIDSLEDALEYHENILVLMNFVYKNTDHGPENLSYFHLACIMKDSSNLKSMLENNVDVNLAVAQDSPVWPGYTGLHFAALCNLDNFMLLLEKGADIQIESAEGLSAFDFYTKNCNPETIHQILTHVKTWSEITLSDNETTLIELVDAMKNSEKLQAFFNNSPQSISAIIPINSPLWPGFSVLHIAVQLSTVDLEIIEVCLESHVDIKTQCANGLTALHLAFRQEKTDIVDLLCQYYDEDSDFIDNENLSHLHIACATLVEEVFVNNLLEFGADVNLVYKGEPIGSFLKRGFTPLHVAVVRGNCEVVMNLLDHGADRYPVDSDGFTPMHWVLESSDQDEIGKELITLDNVKECIVSGLSHLHVACYIDELIQGRNGLLGNFSFVHRLLELPESNVNSVVVYDKEKSPSFLKNLAGHSPLSLAVQTEKWDIARLLVEFGADILMKQPNRSTPMYDALSTAEPCPGVFSFIEVLRKNEELQRRVNEETGLTMSHLNFYGRNREEIKRLMDKGESLNVQIHMDSPIWPGYTPLHVLVRYDTDGYLLHIFQFDFDIMIQNADGDTVIHLAYKYRSEDWLRHLLSTHLKYDEDPVNREGLSHFHIVCAVRYFEDVDEFLKKLVDVNRFVDPFSEMKIAGQSPLHLALNEEKIIDVDDGLSRNWCLKTVNLLIENGARVNAKDSLGKTPLHMVVKLGKNYFDVMQKLFESGVDVNAIDIFGFTPLQTLLTNGGFSAEQLKIFIEHDCKFNVYNSMNENGYISMIFVDHGIESEEKRILFNMMLEYPQTVDTDEKGRTVIHSLVANSATSITSDKYVRIIDQLTRISKNCDIDDQDYKGRTALHLAAEHGNHLAIKGLLIAGADVNITDKKNIFAAIYIENNDSYDESITAFAMQVRKLELLDLDVSLENRAFIAEVFERLDLSDANMIEALQREVELAKSVEIISPSLSLHDYLYEFSTKTTCGTAANQIRIERFFRDFKDERFVELRSVLNLQYRKAVARPVLIEEASISLKRLSKCPMECVDFIVQLLTNNEMKSLIKAV